VGSTIVRNAFLFFVGGAFLARAWMTEGGPAALAGSVLMGLGPLLNALVIAVNGWRMPVDGTGEDPADLDRTGYVAMGPSTRLQFLADWIAAGSWRLSPGDIILVFGAVVLLASTRAGPEG
jgi:hypothetical protein